MALTNTLQLGSLDAEHPLSGRPRLLFLARGFPPARSSSCTRTWNIAKYLSRLGWDVTVVTLHPSIWRQFDNRQEVERKINQEGIKRILTSHRWQCLAHREFNNWKQGFGWFTGGLCRLIARRLGVDNGIGWLAPAERACSNLSKGDVDLILATAGPVSAFRLAKRLSERLECPYVMDYRDPWTQNPHKPEATRPRRIQEEADLIAKSAAVTIVSPSWGEALDRQHKLGSKLHVITNGYDPEDLKEVQPVRFGHFAIVYTGVFYPRKRVITPIMHALKVLKHRHPALNKFFFHYYGPHGEHVRKEASRYDVLDLVVLHGEVSQDIALAAVRGAGVAVVVTSVAETATSDEQGIVTGKIFEPVGMNIPVLLISPPGSDAETVLRATGLGEAFRASDMDGIVAFLLKLMSGCAIGQKPSDEFSWPSIARRLDHVLHGALQNTPARRCII